jgi:hypothetical protein
MLARERAHMNAEIYLYVQYIVKSTKWRRCNPTHSILTWTQAWLAPLALAVFATIGLIIPGFHAFL